MRRSMAVLVLSASLLAFSAASALAASVPRGITAGPDGAMWFAEAGDNEIGRITPDGTVTEFPVPAGRQPYELTTGPDGALWFTEPFADRIGRITTAGAVTEFVVPGAGSMPLGIVTGPDGRLWFTQGGSDQIGAITTAGVVSEFEIPGNDDAPTGITSSPTKIFFTETTSGEIARMSTAGAIEFEIAAPAGSEPSGIAVDSGGLLNFPFRGANGIGLLGTGGGVVLHVPLAVPGGEPVSIAVGSDGNSWFTAPGSGQIGRMSPGLTITNEFPVPFGSPFDIASGAGAGAPLWFTIPSADRIGRIATAGAITTFALPGAPDLTGPQGLQGTAGPAGPAGPAGQTRIGLVAFQVVPASPRAGKRVQVKFALTDPARVSLDVVPRAGKGKAVKVAERQAGTGVGALAWNGRLGGKVAQAGAYKLIVTAEAAGSSASSSIAIRLRKPR